MSTKVKCECGLEVHEDMSINMLNPSRAITCNFVNCCHE